jgi:hypothetical protein
MHCVLNRRELTTEAGFARERTKSGTDQVLPPVNGFGGEFTLVLGEHTMEAVFWRKTTK